MEMLLAIYVNVFEEDRTNLKGIFNQKSGMHETKIQKVFLNKHTMNKKQKHLFQKPNL